ncbi:MAG: hypothetical protein A2Y15_07325 [Clostridiales bacterium GWF2_36_10]|nr:MAG: hypothetical protein A2Y15_07325 [Clostridiales bacterium GWF2_36_10]HAN21303.1 hypothetical protein [Clostridiales bacterium]
MKKILAIIIALTSLFLTACDDTVNSDEAMPKNTIKADNEAVDYYFYYPKTWELDRNDGMISIRYNTSTNSTTQKYASISVSSYTTDKLANDYWQDYADDISKTFHEYELLKEEETKLDEVVATRKEYTGKLSDVKYKFAQVICVRKGTVYLLTLTAAEEDFDTTVIDFGKVVSEFHFK